MPPGITKPRVTEAGAAFIDTDDHEYAVYEGRVLGRPGPEWLRAFEEALLAVEGAREVRVGAGAYGFVCLDERARAVLEALRGAKARADEAAEEEDAGSAPAEAKGEPPLGDAKGPADLVRKYAALVDEFLGRGADTI